MCDEKILKLLKSIENLRKEMHNMAGNNNYSNNKDLLKKSQELDRLLDQYNNLIKKKKKG